MSKGTYYSQACYSVLGFQQIAKQLFRGKITAIITQEKPPPLRVKISCGYSVNISCHRDLHESGTMAFFQALQKQKHYLSYARHLM